MSQQNIGAYGVILFALSFDLTLHHPDDEPVVRPGSEAVSAVCRPILPDLAVLLNAGNFFHNQVRSVAHFHALQKCFIDIAGYALLDYQFRLAAD